MEAAGLPRLRPFVPTVPFRYLPPKQSVRMAFNVILDREPDPAGGAEYAPEAGRRGAVPATAWPRRWPIPRSSAAASRSATCCSPCTSAGASSWPGCRGRRASWTSAGPTRACPTAPWCTWATPIPSSAWWSSISRWTSATRSTREARPESRCSPSSGRWSSPSTPWSTSSRYEDGSFDLVYSGQSIEHVTEADGDAVVREAFRVLAPGGWFCLDTPNGPVWRLRSDAPMNHDHKIEYGAGELVAQAGAGRLRGDRVQGAQPDAPGRGGRRVRRGRGQRPPGRVRRGGGLPVAGGGGPQAGALQAAA